MMLDYPEIVNKLTLFLGAGMTVKRAWKKSSGGLMNDIRQMEMPDMHMKR